MRKFRITIFVTVSILVSALFWGFAGVKIMTNSLKKENLKKCTSLIVSKLLDAGYKNDIRNEDLSITGYQNLYDVQDYNINISIDIPAKMIYGKLIMKSVNLSDTLDRVYLNLENNMKVKLTSLNGNVTDFLHENNYLEIKTGNQIRKNESFQIEIEYEGSPENYGFDSFGFKMIDESPVVYSLSEPEYSPTWWPCKDILTDKTTAEIVLNVPGELTAVSNGILSEVRTEENGSRTFHWKTSYPVATYLISIAVGKYDKWTDTYTSRNGEKQMPVEFYSYPAYTENARSDWKNTVRMIDFFSGLFGEYPFINEKYGMALFGWTGGAMEHQTISSIGYTLVTGNGKYENVIVHELAHQWFGDAVTPKSWKDIWLNEGFASYSEALWEENTDGREAYINTLVKQDYGYFNGTLYDPEGFIFGPTVYNKGAWCLHMLRGTVGDNVFFKILRTYYDKYKYKNAGTEDFKKVCEEISGTDLTYFFEQWIFTGKGRPEYVYSWKADEFQNKSDTGVYMLRINLRQIQENDIEVYKMPVEIKVITETGTENLRFFNNSRNQQFEQPVNGKPLEVLIDNDKWILKKIQKEEYKNTY